MKTFKRNAVILTVLLFVCVAVYLNWTYNNEGDVVETDSTLSDDTEDTAAVDDTDAEDAGLYYVENSETETVSSSVSEYFASVRLSREQARDAAVETLSTVSETAGASQESIDAALAEIAAVAENTILEAELESLIMAKGFEDCVAFISDGGINVTVPAPEEGLSSASVARITDIIIQETDFTAENLKIIEVK